MPTVSPSTTHIHIPSVNRRIGMISTYPPTMCGLATFAAALVNAFTQSGNRVEVIAIDDGCNDAAIGQPIVAKHVKGLPSSIRLSAAALNRCDVAIIQHEYGIYGGPDGDEVLSLLDAIAVPTIVILHTVPLQPTAHQRQILVAICDKADRVVTMTEVARDRLTLLYPINPSNVVTIPHGAAAPAYQTPSTEYSAVARPQLLTWGLLGPGKGIEHVIDALVILKDAGLRPQYTVAGVTHPHVFANHGDHYRQSLMRRVRDAGLARSVTFDATYRSVAELTRFVTSASVVVLPYDSRDQVTSGVLIDAIAAGRAVIATAFPHAVEMLRSGAGIIVPHGDPLALADAIRTLVTDPAALAATSAEASRLSPALLWPAVAERYLKLCDNMTHIAKPIAV